MHCTVNGRVIGGGRPAAIMGVINVSPESFYAGSYVPEGTIRKTAEDMVDRGAEIIDIGARSTAPASPRIERDIEAERMEKALTELDGSGITVSVDTTDTFVLGRCLGHDIHAANDIGGLADPGVAAMVGDAGLPAFLMASLRRPGDAIGLEGTLRALGAVVQRCEGAGIREYVLDPGIGLWVPGRNVDQDWDLCRNFGRFQVFDRPLLAAVSRKSFIGDLLGVPPEKRLSASIVLAVLLRQKGADVVRTHDVAETADALQVLEKMEGR